MADHKTILILSATAGAGHVRAAEALVETAREYPVVVHHHDILDFTFPLFKKLYSDFYFAVVRKSPELWGYFYKQSGRRRGPAPKSPLLKLFDQFNYKKYIKLIDTLQPDAIVCTHFLPYLAISEQMRSPAWKIPVFSVPTDYDIHSLWISPDVTKFYAATDEVAWTLRAHGIREERVMVTGIPVMPQFGKRTGQAPARKELGLSAEAFTVMVLSGGYGIGVIDELVPSLAEFIAGYSRRRCQIVVVCGKNQKLYNTLKRLRYSVPVKLYQYIPFVDRLMESADVLVTKSGGLTVSEALAKELPMIIFDPIPGQEGRNADYLTEHGAAVRASNFPNLHFKLKEMIDRPSLKASMAKRAKKIARPEAGKRILEDVLRQL